MGFDQSVEAMPQLICVGTLKSLGKLKKPGEGKKYSLIPFEIKGQHGSPDAKGNLLFLPSFFAADFSKSRMKEELSEKEYNSRRFVYEAHIAQPSARSKKNGKIATLEGLFGSAVAFGAFAEAKDATFPEGTTPTAEDVYAFIKEQLAGDRPEIGYVLKQQMDKETFLNEETGEEETVRTPGERYELANFWYITEQSVEQQVAFVGKRYKQIEQAMEKGSDKVPGEVKMGFDTTAYGVEMPEAQGEPAWAA